MLPDRVSNPGPLTYESGALPLRYPARHVLLIKTAIPPLLGRNKNLKQHKKAPKKMHFYYL